MMKLYEILKNLTFAAVFGFMGLIIGIWTADLLYSIILKYLERVTTIYLSLIIIISIAAVASFIGFTKGKDLLESHTGAFD